MCVNVLASQAKSVRECTLIHSRRRRLLLKAGIKKLNRLWLHKMPFELKVLETDLWTSWHRIFLFSLGAKKVELVANSTHICIIWVENKMKNKNVDSQKLLGENQNGDRSYTPL